MVGNTPNYTKTDVLRCFLRLNTAASRNTLAKELELGEGTVRTILSILKEKELLHSSKKGHIVSRKGKNAFEKISACINECKRVKFDRIYPELKKFGIVLPKKKVRNNYRLRDIAVKNGAEGALILEFDGRLTTPEEREIVNYKELENEFKLNNNDILILAFADSYRNAENGAFAIAVEIADEIKGILER